MFLYEGIKMVLLFLDICYSVSGFFLVYFSNFKFKFNNGEKKLKGVGWMIFGFFVVFIFFLGLEFVVFGLINWK